MHRSLLHPAWNDSQETRLTRSKNKQEQARRSKKKKFRKPAQHTNDESRCD
jgi:hypothetical protein